MHSKIIFIITVIPIAFFSCARHDCPDPIVVIDTTTYNLLIKPGAEGMDAVVDNYQPNKNFGSENYFWVHSWTISGRPIVWRSLIRFDYSVLPLHAKVQSAKLFLYADTSTVSNPKGHSTLKGSNEWYVKRVTSNWTESLVTWNTQPATDTVGQLYLPASRSESDAYTIDLTAFVKNEINNPTKFFGIMMQLKEETPFKALKFCSSDHKYPQLHPRLEVKYKK